MLDVKWIPAFIAIAAIAGAVALALADHTQVALAVSTIGIAVQAFLHPVARKVPPDERTTLPEVPRPAEPAPEPAPTETDTWN